VGAVEVLQAAGDVGGHSAQGLAAKDHPRAAHAEVLVELQGQQAELLAVALARLADELRLGAVDGAQETLQLGRLHVDIVVRPDEPLEPVDVVLIHVVQHHEGLLLRRIAIVDVLEGHHGQILGVAALGAEEGHPAGHLLAPRIVHRPRPALQKVLGRHHAHEDEVPLGVLDAILLPQADDLRRRLKIGRTQAAALHDLQGPVVLQHGADAKAQGDPEAGDDQRLALRHRVLQHRGCGYVRDGPYPNRGSVVVAVVQWAPFMGISVRGKKKKGSDL